MTLDEAIQHSESLANADVPDMYHGMIAKYLRELREARLHINRLEREADWLAAKLEYYNTPHECELCADTPNGWGKPCQRPLKEQNCAKCWRDAAHEAVERENEAHKSAD